MQRIQCALVSILIVGSLCQSASAVAQTAAPVRWRGTIDLTIGGIDADDNSSFGRISGLTVDRSGRIFTADAQDNQIRVFSPTGAFVTRIGRMGSGPLEFKRLSTIAIGPDALLWARDESNARILAIDVSVSPARGMNNVPLQNFTGGSRLPMTFIADGSLVDETIWFDKSLGAFRPLRLRRSVAGSVSRTDTLTIPDGAFAGVHKVTQVQKDASGKEVGMSERYYSQPFGAQWIRAYGPNGLRSDVVSSRYEIRIFDSNEQLVRTIKRSVVPVALSTRERNKSDSTLRAIKQQLPFGVPSAKAPIVGMRWSQEGQLWVERAVADGSPREADVFDQSGRLIASAEWPREVDLLSGFPVIIGTTVTAVATDESDVERVVRLRFQSFGARVP